MLEQECGQESITLTVKLNLAKNRGGLFIQNNTSIWPGGRNKEVLGPLHVKIHVPKTFYGF